MIIQQYRKDLIQHITIVLVQVKINHNNAESVPKLQAIIHFPHIFQFCIKISHNTETKLANEAIKTRMLSIQFYSLLCSYTHCEFLSKHEYLLGLKKK